MNDEKRKGLLTTIAVCLFIIICFGFLRIPSEQKNPQRTEKIVTHIYHPEAVSSTAHAAHISYILRIEEGELRLYLNSDGEVLFLESFEINESLFPSADIAELKEGITLPGLEETIGIIEDFTS